MSSFLLDEAKPGTVLYLGEVQGDFTLTERPTEPLLFISAGSGVTPFFALLRHLERQGWIDDVKHVDCVRSEDDLIFASALRRARRAGRPATACCPGTASRTAGSARELDELVPGLARPHDLPLRAAGDDRGVQTALGGRRASRTTSSWNASSPRPVPTSTPARAAPSGSASRRPRPRPTGRRRSSRPARTPGSPCASDAGWASATPASAGSPKAPSATCDRRDRRQRRRHDPHLYQLS